MIWLLHHESETIEKMTLVEFMEKFNTIENFSNIYSIVSMKYDYPWKSHR